MGGLNKDLDQKLQERTQTGQYLPTPEQREQCLAELKGGSSGGDRADPFQTQTPECGDSVRRPVRKDLEEKGLKKPGKTHNRTLSISLSVLASVRISSLPCECAV
jgi:hypothetical protein